MSWLTLIIPVVLGAAVVGGLLVRRFHLRGRNRDHPLAGLEGLSVSELVVPARTLAPLVLAFAVVAVHGSYDDVGQQAATEAAAVLSMGEDSLLLAPPARAEVLGDLRCYAASVAGPDWEAAAAGVPSPQTDAAADRLTVALQRATADGQDSSAVSAILAGNAQRIETRLHRFEDARPSVPGVVWLLLLLTMATMLGGLAVFVRPGVRRGLHLAVLAATTVIFGLALIVVDDLDHPYGGLSRIEPTAMRTVEHRLATLPVPPSDTPCDTGAADTRSTS